MYRNYNDQSSEYTDPVFENYTPGNYSPADEYNGPDKPQFEDYPPMHGGPDFDDRPPMHGRSHHGRPEFDDRPPMHRGPHRSGPGFDDRPPMHGGPHRGDPHFRPCPEGPGFEDRPPMPDGPENFGTFRELPFDIPGQYETLPIDGKLLHNFRLLSHQIHAAREGAAGQQRILTILSAVPSISQRQLMELLGVRAGSLSEVIGKLEAVGKIRRVPNPNDRRVLMVSITPKGMAAVNESKKNSPDLFEVLTDAEKQTLLALLEKILAGETLPAHNSNATFEC